MVAAYHYYLSHIQILLRRGLIAKDQKKIEAFLERAEEGKVDESNRKDLEIQNMSITFIPW